MSKNDNRTNACNLEKASEVLRNRLESLFGEYFEFKFITQRQCLCIQCLCIAARCTYSFYNFYVFAIDKNAHTCYINFNGPDKEEIPTRNAVERLLDYSKNHDIYIEFLDPKPLKLLKSGETLESLAIEYDLLT